MTFEQVHQLYDLMQVVQAELKVDLADVDPLDSTPWPDYRKVKALAAAYELQDFAANKLAETDPYDALIEEYGPESLRGQIIAAAKMCGGFDELTDEFEAFCYENADSPEQLEEYQNAFAELRKQSAECEMEG